MQDKTHKLAFAPVYSHEPRIRSICRSLRRLEAKELVERTKGKSRTRLVSLTVRGWRVVLDLIRADLAGPRPEQY